MAEILETRRFDSARSLLSKRCGAFSLGMWCMLALIPLVLYTFNLGGARALTEHESLVAGPAKQIVLDNEWLLLRIGDQYWLEKPPLPYWLAALSSKIAGGFTEASVRLPSALAGVGVVLLVAGLMAKLFGETIGVLCGLIQATTTYMMAYARLAEADMVLLLIVTAAIAVFVHLQQLPEKDSSRWRKFWLISFWMLIGLTNLSKGMLFGAALTLLTCGGGLVVSRNWANLKRMWSPTGMLAAAAISIIWPAWVMIEEPAVIEIWNAHLFGRAAGSLGYTQPVWYYLKTWPSQLLPWTPLLFLGAGASLRRAWFDKKSPDRFVWWWAVSQLCLLSSSSGKHHHYLIYALPAMSPVIAMGLLRSGELMAAGGRWALYWGRIWFWIVAPAVVVGGLIGGQYAGTFRPDVWALSGILAAGCLAVGYFTIRSAPVPTLVSFMSLVLVANLYVQGAVMPRRDPSAADKQFLLAVDRELPADAQIVTTITSDIARNMFYLDRKVDGVWDADDLGNVLEDNKSFYAIVREKNRATLERFGRTTKLNQSLRTRREKKTTDRFTLYRVDRLPHVAAGSNGNRK